MIVGVVSPLASRRLPDRRGVHVGRLRGVSVRRAALVFGALFVHSLPEGFAIGTAFASDTEGESAGVCRGSGGRGDERAAAHRSDRAYLAVEVVQGLLPFSFGFAAGAMLALVVFEPVPEAFPGGGRVPGLACALLGAALMPTLAAGLGVEG